MKAEKAARRFEGLPLLLAASPIAMATETDKNARNKMMAKWANLGNSRPISASDSILLGTLDSVEVWAWREVGLGGVGNRSRRLVSLLRASSDRPKWAMWELTTRGFSSDGRTFPGPGGDRGCERASVPVRVPGPRAFSAVVDHVSPCWYQGRSPWGRIRRG